jgi:hypothetical protein
MVEGSEMAEARRIDVNLLKPRAACRIPGKSRLSNMLGIMTGKFYVEKKLPQIDDQVAAKAAQTERTRVFFNEKGELIKGNAILGGIRRIADAFLYFASDAYSLKIVPSGNKLNSELVPGIEHFNPSYMHLNGNAVKFAPTLDLKNNKDLLPTVYEDIGRAVSRMTASDKTGMKIFWQHREAAIAERLHDGVMIAKLEEVYQFIEAFEKKGISMRSSAREKVNRILHDMDKRAREMERTEVAIKKMEQMKSDEEAAAKRAADAAARSKGKKDTEKKILDVVTRFYGNDARQIDRFMESVRMVRKYIKDNGCMGEGIFNDIAYDTRLRPFEIQGKIGMVETLYKLAKAGIKFTFVESVIKHSYGQRNDATDIDIVITLPDGGFAAVEVKKDRELTLQKILQQFLGTEKELAGLFPVLVDPDGYTSTGMFHRQIKKIFYVALSPHDPNECPGKMTLPYLTHNGQSVPLIEFGEQKKLGDFLDGLAGTNELAAVLAGSKGAAVSASRVNRIGTIAKLKEFLKNHKDARSPFLDIDVCFIKPGEAFPAL